MKSLNFQKIFRSLFFLACLSFVLWQCFLLFDKFVKKPRSTSVGIDYAKNWPMPKLIICPPINSAPLVDCKGPNELISICHDCPESHPDEALDYLYRGRWSTEKCSDPKNLFEEIILQPIEFFDSIYITTFQGESVRVNRLNDSFNSFWNPLDFVYDSVTFEQYAPISAFCYELVVPKKLQSQGIKFIDIRMLWDEPEFIKISPPGFLYQNSAIETKYSKGEILMLNIEYEIDNVLDIGEGQTCNPDPSYSRDECVINQLLNKSMELFGCIPPALGNYGFQTCLLGNSSSFSMREVDKLIDCTKPCSLFTIRPKQETVLSHQILNLENVHWPWGLGKKNRIEVRFKELISVSQDQYSYLWLNLVAEVGGYVGLFLGFSVFQLTDLLDMFLRMNWIGSFKKSLLNLLKSRQSDDSVTSIKSSLDQSGWSGSSFSDLSTGKGERESNYQKILTGFIFLVVLSFVLVLVVLGLTQTKTQDQCLPGHYNFPTCKKCECNSDGAITCNENGDCICKARFTGSKCDECKPNFIGDKCDTCQPNYYFKFPSCQECGCNPDGSTSLQCDANGNCTCKDGFGGKQCDVCKEEGFTGSKCDECKPNVIGDKCDECQPNYFNYPSCQECKCNTDNSASLQCDANGNCTCKDGFGGEQCDVCKEEGFTGSKCDECKPNIIGGKCDACQPNYFNYPSCQECNCNPVGSTTLECNTDGYCTCKDGFFGKQCDTGIGCGGNPGWIGDNICDDANNNAGCNYDGGDCCGDGNTSYCIECICKQE